MQTKSNCWEAMKCGREAGGIKVSEMGVCPASTDTEADGVNGGKNGGRLCWTIAGSFCNGKQQGTFAQKRLCCVVCDFIKQVQKEEGVAFELLKPNQTWEKDSFHKHFPKPGR